MARIHSQTIEIKVSQLLRGDQDETKELVSSAVVEQLEAVVAELVGAGVVVEAATKD